MTLHGVCVSIFFILTAVLAIMFLFVFLSGNQNQYVNGSSITALWVFWAAFLLVTIILSAYVATNQPKDVATNCNESTNTNARFRINNQKRGKVGRAGLEPATFGS